MSALQIVLSTCPTDDAPRLARLLVNERLAACVNILPGLTSVYRWQDALHEDQEVLMIIKTSADQQAELFARLAAEHPYDVPEITSLSCDSTLPAYLSWVIDATTRNPS